MRTENKEKIHAYCESLYPLVLSVLIAGGSLYVSINKVVAIGDGLWNIINSIIVFTSIIVGFLGVLLGILFSLRNQYTINILFKNKTKDILRRYFIAPMITGVLSVFTGCLLFVNVGLDSMFDNVCYRELTMSDIALCLWIFLTTYMITSAYRIISIIMRIIFSNDEEIIREKVELDQMHKDKLKEKHSK